MPPTAPKKSRPVPDRDVLVKNLAAAMSLEVAAREPRVIWNPLPIEGKLDIIVIWSCWRGISYEERTAIILEACEKHEEGMIDKIYTAIGRTFDEAIDLGYLPVRVAPVPHRIEQGDWGRIDEALVKEGAVRTETGLQLRFVNFDEAQEAFLRLQEKIPGPYWTIVEEIARDF